MSSANDPRLSGPDALEHELAQEQAHVDRVYAQLKHVHKNVQQAAAQGNAIYQYDRADYAREEDSTAMFERDAFSFQAAKRLAILDSEHEGLVFGRLDHTTQETRYIGRIGVRDDEYEPLVIDWRAPAAEPFYRATPADPMTVARRRVLRCRGEKVIGIEDDLLDSDSDSSLVIIGEGALMAALSRARGHQMRDIVATIQSEQDQAIRAPYAGVTVISGGPGTGKTVVALHRAAYLLYSNRRRFENGGVLVVGPSGIFMNYIDRVLPSLGEDSVTLRAIGDVAGDVVNLHRVRGELERMDDAVTAQIKGSLQMVPLLRKLVALPLVDQSQTLRVVVKGDVLTLTAKQLKRVRSDVLANHQMNKSKDQAQHGLIHALWQHVPSDLEISHDEFETIVQDSAAFQMFVNAWWPMLTPERVLLRLSDPHVTDQVGSELSDTERKALISSYADLINAQNPHWTVADAALLDELYALLGPMPPQVVEDDFDPTEFLEVGSGVSELISTADKLTRVIEIDPDDEGHRTYAHVLVDEAQDITPMQWRMLRRRGPQASWTIVGDPAQSSWPKEDEVAKAITDLIGNAPHRTFRMSTNYRSPAEVFDLAGKIVQASYPNADLPQAVRSTGVEPELLAVVEADLAAELHRVIVDQAAAVEGTIGIIAPVSRLTTIDGLVQSWATTQPGFAAIQSRISVLTPLAVKGLEFDAVIVIDPDGIVSESSGGVRVLYVALTRPTQRLVTLDINAEAKLGAWQEPLNENSLPLK